MPHHAATILDTGELFARDDGESVLHGLARTGRRGIPVRCRSGGRGVCKVEIVAGSYDQPIMSGAHVWPQGEMDGPVLACHITPRQDLAIKVIGRLAKTVLRAAGGEG